MRDFDRDKQVKSTFKHSRKNDSPMPIMNNKIRFSNFMLIDQDGSNLGVMSKEDALKIAESKNLDLILISQNGENPIAKILDYGKYRYEQQIKQKLSKKKQSVQKVKSITIKPIIGVNDLKVKAENAKRWLADGDRVKFIIKTFGRLMTRDELINETYNKFMGFIGSEIKILKELTKVGKGMFEAIFESNQK